MGVAEGGEGAAPEGCCACAAGAGAGAFAGGRCAPAGPSPAPQLPPSPGCALLKGDPWELNVEPEGSLPLFQASWPA